jgi:cyclase
MLRTRVMPCLLLRNSKLVKTVKFKNPRYVGDPVNAVKIYNDKEVDELIFLDITATVEKRAPPFKTISEIATECFMPYTYGGGIGSIEDMKKVFASGVEKIAINSRAVESPSLVKKAAAEFGNQSVVVSIDAKRNPTGKYEVFTRSGTNPTGVDPVTHARRMEEMGAGEILLTSIDRDGTWDGYDLELIRMVAEAVTVPLIVCGGAGGVQDFRKAVDAGASACAAGSMVVYQAKDRGVLIRFPMQAELRKVLP